ncbi:MAG: dephospho-CoA kinase [Burkholderiales bacterium]|nr:dephospho-CoA kinase [Burkholderiales bacterium]
MTASPFSVGLTGGIGSGKSTVASLFAEHGAPIIDTDVIAHRLTAPGGLAIAAIRAQFGPQFIDSTGALDRALMRERVFADPHAKKHLEAILHPMIRNECEREAAQAQGPYLIFVVPLLIESPSWRQRVSRVLVVDIPENEQIIRVMTRSGLSEDAVRAIMATQATREQRLAAADDVISNIGDPATLVPEVDKLHTLYSSLAKNSSQHL